MKYLILSFLLSCTGPIPKKPFTIVGKDCSNYLTCRYWFVDPLGNEFNFTVIADKENHQIGDIIK